MSVRFRKSFRLGGVRLNVTKNGVSSITLGGKGASLNIPVARSGGIRGTVGLPGSGLSYSREFKAFSKKVASEEAQIASSRSQGFKAFSAEANASIRSSKLKAANIENRKMVGPIFAAFGGLFLLLFVAAVIGATFSTTEPGGSIPQIEEVDPQAPNGIPGDCSGNRWMSRGCTSGTSAIN